MNFAKKLLLLISCIFIQFSYETEVLPLHQDCINAYKYDNPVCLHNTTLYHYTGSVAVHQISCAHCLCGSSGWNGTECGCCTSVDVCPRKLINGVYVEPSNCTNTELIPTKEELIEGKRFSCSCGGGEDSISTFLCENQADTSFEFFLFGGMTSSDPGYVKMDEFAGIHGKSWESYPGQYNYSYPLVMNGTFTDCVITEGKCFYVPNTNVQDLDCVLYSCAHTDVDCPPKGYPVCPGYPNCDTPAGESSPYKMHSCNAVPQSGKSFDVACVKEIDSTGRFVCYYQQPDYYSPLSMTCRVGNCIYNSTQINHDSDDGGKVVIYDIAEQLSVLGAISGSIVIFSFGTAFFLFIRIFPSYFKRNQQADNLENEQQQLFINSDLPSSTPKLKNVVQISTSDYNLLQDLDKPKPVTLTWNNINLHVPGRKRGEFKHVLRHVNGIAGPTEQHPFVGGLCALMGPSGAGKTSLLNILAARIQTSSMHVTGDIHVDGCALTHEQRQKLSAYVTQEDILPGTLTVFEHLIFHAQLRISNDIPLKDKVVRVNNILHELGLWHIRDSLIGNEFRRGISGGEKRRVSIGTELLTSPSILFMDEPTTGLDSSNAINVIQLLARVSIEHGTTIILSIHQPRIDIFKLFSSVLLLSSKGKTIYFGPSASAYSYFQQTLNCPPLKASENPADLMLDICCSDQGKNAGKIFVQTQLHEELMHRINKAYQQTPSRIVLEIHESFKSSVSKTCGYCCQGPSFFTQLTVLSDRLLKNSYRHPMLLGLHFIGSILMSACLGSIFKNLADDLYGVQDRFGVLFFILFYLSLLGMSSLPVWRDERRLFLHEYSSGIYNYPAYFSSIALFDIILVRVIPPLFFAFISYQMIGLEDNCENCLLIFSLILVLTNIIAALAAMAIGAIAPSGPAANVFGGMTILIYLLFGGFILNRSQIPIEWRWLMNITPLSYAFEALLINEFTSSASVKFYEINGSYCAPNLPLLYASGSTILHTFDFSSSDSVMNSDIHFLILLVVLYFCGAYLILRFSAPVLNLISKLGTCWFLVDDTHDIQNLDTSSQSRSVSSIEDLSHETRQLIHTPELINSHNNSVVAGAPVLSWEDVSLWVPVGIRSKKKQILRNVTGFAGPLADDQSNAGTILGIMGPSGAGKTSLLDILAGRKTVGTITGNFYINGYQISYKKIQDISGYVVQDDVLPGMLTVYEHLLFHAKMRMPQQFTVNQLQERVEQILMELGLKHISNSFIGNQYKRGISGGEKRRVSIATELITKPTLLFMDEPTTGLDSSNAIKVIQLLSNVALLGTTIILSIHQPRIDIYQLLSRVLLLSSNGELVYCGPASGITEVFSDCFTFKKLTSGSFSSTGGLPKKDKEPSGMLISSTSFKEGIFSLDNPADVMLDALTHIHSSNLIAKFETSSYYPLLKQQVSHIRDHPRWTIPLNMKYKASFIRQLQALSIRAMKNTLRHPFLIMLNLILAALVAVCLGSLFADINQYNEETTGTQDRLGIFFFFLTYLSLLSLSSLPIWMEEQRLFIHERNNGVYGTLSYFISASLFEIIPYRLLPPFMFSAISYSWIGLHSGFSHIVNFTLILVLTNLTMSAICMAVGAASRSNAVSNASGALIVLFSLLFAGYLLNKDQIPDGWKWLQVISPTFYAFEALLANEFHGLEGFYITTVVGSGTQKGGPFSGEEILSCFGFNSDRMHDDILVLVYMFIACLITIFLLLRFFVREKR